MPENKNRMTSAMSTSKVRVLLVDDQLIIVEALRRMLGEQPDIEFHHITDGAIAVDTALHLQPTVILQDLIMPAIDGFGLIRQYRDCPQLANVPVIVLSSKEDPKLKAFAFEVGANDYLVKLPDRLELLARVRYHSRPTPTASSATKRSPSCARASSNWPRPISHCKSWPHSTP